MEDTVRTMLRTLTEAFGPSGFEDDVRDLVRGYLGELGEIKGDRLGSVYTEIVGDPKGPKIWLAGHLDEIGFLITQVTEEGFLRFQTLGGWWEQVMLAQRVCIRTRQGDVIGVIGSKPPHVLSAKERGRVTEKKDMFIDIGVGCRQAALEAGVRVGDAAVPICPFQPMADPKYLLAKAWDNRIGCAIAIETARRVKSTKHPNRLFAGATIQEEVGLRGAKTSTYAVDPDIGIALDVGIGGDTPGIKAHEAKSKLGDGPLILIFDGSLIPSRKLRDFITAVAEEAKIPYQLDHVAGGGTDAGAMHLTRSGVPSIAIGVPARYIHSHASVIHADDFENTVALLTRVLEKLDRSVLDRVAF